MLSFLGGCALWRNDPQPKSLGLKQAAEHPPQNAATSLDGRIAYETARLAEQRGMDDEAIANFEKARSLNPELKGVAHSLAVLYDRAGRVDAAEREYEKALAEESDNADVHCDYGYFLHSTRRPQEAETHLRQALELAPDHKQSQINLGLVLGTEGQFDEAQQLFTAAIGPAAAQHNIGILKLKRGDVVSAREHLSIAARRDPSLSQTQAILATISDQSMIR